MLPLLKDQPASKSFSVLDLGVKEYGEVYSLQQDWVARKRDLPALEDQLFLVEHPEVYTFGRKSGELPPGLSPCVSVERGGEATFHNPGQLVCYPVLALQEGERDAHLHLRRLEETLILVLAEYGIKGERREKATGVWITGKNKKIASIGVALKGWISYHGCALNVENDLKGFYRINPCGYSAEIMTSMKDELGIHCPPLDEVKKSFVRNFSTVFGRVLH